MKVVLAHTKQTVRGQYLLECMADGIRSCGDSVEWLEKASQMDRLDGATCAVQVCLANAKHRERGTPQFRQLLARETFKRGQRLLVVDTGFLRNQTQLEIQQDSDANSHVAIFNTGSREHYAELLDEITYELAFDGIKGFGDHCNADSPPDRWEAMRERFGLELQPWREDPGPDAPVVVLGQTRYGSSTQDLDVMEWTAKRMVQIRRLSKRPIVYRMHPRTFKRPDRKWKEAERLRKRFRGLGGFSVSDHWELEQDLAGAWAAVGYTTNATVSCIVQGVPTFIGSPNCVAHPVSAGGIGSLENPETPDRTQWLRDLCYAQWTCREMMDGTAWRHLRDHASQPMTRSTPL